MQIQRNVRNITSKKQQHVDMIWKLRLESFTQWKFGKKNAYWRTEFKKPANRIFTITKIKSMHFLIVFFYFKSTAISMSESFRQFSLWILCTMRSFNTCHTTIFIYLFFNAFLKFVRCILLMLYTWEFRI